MGFGKWNADADRDNEVDTELNFVIAEAKHIVNSLNAIRQLLVGRPMNSKVVVHSGRTL